MIPVSYTHLDVYKRQGIENYSLRFLEQALELPVYFENDANAAMLAEKKQK